MRKERLVTHAPAAIAIMTFFLFQMAMLVAMNASLEKIVISKEQGRTYTRSTIKSEADAMARYPKIYKKVKMY